MTIRLDGVFNNDPNCSTSIVLPSIDALQEFKVQSGVYPANQATQINVLTKSAATPFTVRSSSSFVTTT